MINEGHSLEKKMSNVINLDLKKEHSKENSLLDIKIHY